MGKRLNNKNCCTYCLTSKCNYFKIRLTSWWIILWSRDSSVVTKLVLRKNVRNQAKESRLVLDSIKNISVDSNHITTIIKRSLRSTLFDIWHDRFLFICQVTQRCRWRDVLKMQIFEKSNNTNLDRSVSIRRYRLMSLQAIEFSRSLIDVLSVIGPVGVLGSRVPTYHTIHR